jgi:hypothetical protein
VLASAAGCLPVGITAFRVFERIAQPWQPAGGGLDLIYHHPGGTAAG